MEGTGDWTTRKLWVLEANIDDMTGEAAAYLTEKLLEVPNCLDAWLSPILMKKGRPAFTVHVLCEPEDQERTMRVLFTESTTLGVRRRSVERSALRRKTISVSTTFGDVRVKVGGGTRSHLFLSVLADTFKVYSMLDYMPSAVHIKFPFDARRDLLSSRYDCWSYISFFSGHFLLETLPAVPFSCLVVCARQ